MHKALMLVDKCFSFKHVYLVDKFQKTLLPMLGLVVVVMECIVYIWIQKLVPWINISTQMTQPTQVTFFKYALIFKELHN